MHSTGITHKRPYENSVWIPEVFFQSKVKSSAGSLPRGKLLIFTNNDLHQKMKNVDPHSIVSHCFPNYEQK